MNDVVRNPSGLSNDRHCSPVPGLYPPVINVSYPSDFQFNHAGAREPRWMATAPCRSEPLRKVPLAIGIALVNRIEPGANFIRPTALVAEIFRKIERIAACFC